MSKPSLLRRVLAPKRILAALAVIVGSTLLTGASFEWLSRRGARTRFPVQGRLVDIGGRHLQLDCRGSGSPTVVFEAGLDMLGSLSWAAVHDSVAKITRACAYSRAGIMWSDASTAPFSSEQVARDLRAVLRNAGESAPFIMVGHSLGGPYVMTFNALYGPEVAGVVLVDASHPDQVAQIEKATGMPMTPPTGILAFGSAVARTGLPRLMTRDVAPARASQFVREASAGYASMSISAFTRDGRGA
jgi:pimeloyl-ACP methyl ester carboxylesterase